MSTWKVLIIDDEISGCEVLENLISKSHPELKLLPSARTVEQAIALIDREHPELIFLDIKLGNQTGFDLLEKTAFKDFHIIFVTAYSQYALKAIKTSAIDYLLKPVNRNELMLAIEKVKKREAIELDHVVLKRFGQLIENASKVKARKISIPTAEGYELLPVADLLYLVADRNYCEVYLKSGTKKITTRHLGSFEESLPDHFVRIHKSNMVNVHEVVLYSPGNGGFVKMSNGKRLEVSRRRRKTLLEAIEIDQN